jgi:hypothetical protein
LSFFKNIYTVSRNTFSKKIAPEGAIAIFGYKGLIGTGFGDPKTNPMNNPESVKKMLETRKINREKKRGLSPSK